MPRLSLRWAMRCLRPALALLIAVACGCGPSDPTGSRDRAIFARGGIVLPGDASPDVLLDVTTTDNTTVRLTAGLPVGG
ncbi:MAG TPA: hypothetical protein VMZ92_17915, partial [Planctomycetota bacterium]|nr:hypothetical protein [Planctomycetota bacterium]